LISRIERLSIRMVQVWDIRAVPRRRSERQILPEAADAGFSTQL
jgi:hypothetical protein